MKIMMVGECTHEIKSTRLGNGWGVRCFTNGVLNQEIRVKCQEDISVASAEMLRWEDKCGNISQQASSSRNRFNKGEKHRGYKFPSQTVVIH
jgi:hypothetical protein